MTHVMFKTASERLYEAFRSDEDLRRNAQLLYGACATIEKLGVALTDRRPGLLVTTSHGSMNLTGNRLADSRSLGVPMDQEQRLLDYQGLLSAWQPDGAIWFAQACCSAGSTGVNPYEGLVHRSSNLHVTLDNISKTMKSRTAPLPRALLAPKKPLRTFIGHVGPTFDRTMIDPSNHQKLMDFRPSLYRNLFQFQPVARAMREHFAAMGSLFRVDQRIAREVNAGEPGSRERQRDVRLRSMDLSSMVILGDPTVALPK